MIYTQILGRFADNPSIKQAKNGNQFTVFTLATNIGIDDKNKTVYISVYAFAEVGKKILKYFEKGNQILVIGTIYDFGATVGADDLAHFHFIVTCEAFEFIGINKKKHAENLSNMRLNPILNNSQQTSLFENRTN